MGRHSAGFDFERGRRIVLVWAPAVGLGLLTGLLLTALAWSSASTTRNPTAGLPTLPAVVPPIGPTGVTAEPSSPVTVAPRPRTPAPSQSPVSAAPQPSVSNAPRPSVSKAPQSPVSKPSPTAAPADVTGRYRVVDSYGTGFIGEVLIANTSGVSRSWTVRLLFDGEVGVMQTFWVESQPQATLQRSGAAYIFTGAVPVAARSTVVLRLQFDGSGPNRQPVSCTTNGRTCTGP